MYNTMIIINDEAEMDWTSHPNNVLVLFISLLIGTLTFGTSGSR